MDTDFYLGLITDRNDRREKFKKYARMLLEQALEEHAIVNSMPWAFDLYNAAGVQLDTIGIIVGLTRQLPYDPGASVNEMDDEEYRLMLRMKIARNIWSGTNEDARQIYQTLFDDEEIKVIYYDNQDMTLTYTMSGIRASRLSVLLYSKPLLLIPGGVGYNVDLKGDTSPVKVNAGSIAGARNRLSMTNDVKRDSENYINPKMAVTAIGEFISTDVVDQGRERARTLRLSRNAWSILSCHVSNTMEVG